MLNIYKNYQYIYFRNMHNKDSLDFECHKHKHPANMGIGHYKQTAAGINITAKCGLIVFILYNSFHG